jgi:hypothetical protein
MVEMKVVIGSKILVLLLLGEDIGVMMAPKPDVMVTVLQVVIVLRLCTLQHYPFNINTFLIPLEEEIVLGTIIVPSMRVMVIGFVMILLNLLVLIVMES